MNIMNETNIIIITPQKINTIFSIYCCDWKSRAANAQSFALWQQATIEFTCHDHSPHTLAVTFNRWHC